MPENTTDRLVLEVNRTHAEGGIQVVLSQIDAKGTGWGYRLAGPKHYNSGATPLLSADLTERDATELRSMLDAVFPVAPRVIESPEELDALPVDSVILHPAGPAFGKVRILSGVTGWYAPGSTLAHDAADLFDDGPVTVLHIPAEDTDRA